MMMKRSTIFLVAALAVVLFFPFVTMASGMSGAGKTGQERSIALYNTHTSESLQAVFWQNGHYVPSALEAVNSHLRDHRNGHVHEISYDLLNLLYDVRQELERRHPGQEIVFHVISGYRSPESNAMMRAAGGGQGKDSRHMYGDAIDIRVPGVDTAEIRDIAWCMQRGGVGFYEGSDFTHIDTDRVRHWKWTPKAGLCKNHTSS